MAHRLWIVALGGIVAASPLAAATTAPTLVRPAATDSADTRYCLRVEAVTGTRIETVRCWTRLEWAEQGVDVDKDWAAEGVAVIAPGGTSPV